MCEVSTHPAKKRRQRARAAGHLWVTWRWPSLETQLEAPLAWMAAPSNPGNLLLFPLNNPWVDSGILLLSHVSGAKGSPGPALKLTGGETGMKRTRLQREGGGELGLQPAVLAPGQRSAHSEVRIASFIFSHATVMSFLHFCFWGSQERKGGPRVITCFRETLDRLGKVRKGFPYTEGRAAYCFLAGVESSSQDFGSPNQLLTASGSFQCWSPSLEYSRPSDSQGIFHIKHQSQPSQRSLSEDSMGNNLFSFPILLYHTVLLLFNTVVIHILWRTLEFFYLLICLFIFCLPTTCLSPRGQEAYVCILCHWIVRRYQRPGYFDAWELKGNSINASWMNELSTKKCQEWKTASKDDIQVGSGTSLTSGGSEKISRLHFLDVETEMTATSLCWVLTVCCAQC